MNGDVTHILVIIMILTVGRVAGWTEAELLRNDLQPCQHLVQSDRMAKTLVELSVTTEADLKILIGFEIK